MSRSLSGHNQWRRIVRRQAGSGMSVAAFCRRQGVAYSSFFVWKRKLAIEGPGSSGGAFVGVQAVADQAEPSGEGHEATDGGIELRLGSRLRIHLRRGFDRQVLGELIALVERMEGVA